MLVQGQELTFLIVWINVVHGKRISRYLAVVVCRHNDMFQRYGVNPNGGLRKPYHIFQVNTTQRCGDFFENRRLDLLFPKPAAIPLHLHDNG